MRTIPSIRKALSLLVLLSWLGAQPAYSAEPAPVATAPLVLADTESATLEREDLDSGPSTCSNSSVAARRTSGPDLIVGHVWGCESMGREGALGSGTTGMSCYASACTKGDMGTNWFGLPSVDHPMISVNLFRQWRRDGSDRLEQVGRGWIKHGVGTGNRDECGFGCTPGGFNINGPGCSDGYEDEQLVACDLGPRSIIHPFTGVMPTGDLGAGGGCTLNFASRDHRDHIHDQISHRVQVLDADLFPSLNVGARYVAEVQYIVPHEFVDGNGTQNNNVAHRRLLVSGPNPCGTIGFVEQWISKAESPAIDAWSGASQALIEPFPLSDGRGFLVHQVTDLGGVWRYDYALYNMNMDASFRSISIPLPAGVEVTNVGFHFPLNHAPEPHTENHSNTPWVASTGGGAITWSTDTFGTDPLANAVRWGTMYNFYFDANTPPEAASASVGLFKTGGTAMVATVGPGAGPVDCNANLIEDRCDVSCGLSGCSVPGCGTKADCNSNFVPDECEPDCNNNTVPDRCDIAAFTSGDCDADAIPDECEAIVDCNANALRDDCELYSNPGLDEDHNGLIDVCAAPVTTVWYVDDDAPNDPGPGITVVSDPAEDGSLEHPFDAIQEGLYAAAPHETVLVRPGLYQGSGNVRLNFLARPITLRSQRGPDFTTIDIEDAYLSFISHGTRPGTRIEGFEVLHPDADDIADHVIYVHHSNPTIVDSRFIGSFGGGISVIDQSRPNIAGCEFQGFFAGVSVSFSQPTLADSLIYDSDTGVSVQSGDGTVGCASSTTPHLINTTISRCSRGVSVGSSSRPIIENSILWGNTVAQVDDAGSNDAELRYTDVQGGWTGAGIGVLNVDPLFIDPVGGNFRPAPTSPCIDAGNNLVVATLRDLDGTVRRVDHPLVLDTGVGTAPIVDLGAFEWTDCNNNGIDDSTDIGNLTSADCNRNGVPDECDLAAGTSFDCTANGVLDECEPDCQPNGEPDDCDILNATSEDLNSNSIPDECEGRPPIIQWNPDPLYALRATRSVTISVTAATASGGAGSSAIQFRMVDLQSPNPPNPLCCPPQNFSAYEAATCTAVGETGGCNRWLGPVQTFYESSGNPLLGSFRGSRLQCTPYYYDWTTEPQVTIVGAEVVPSSTYELRAYGSSCKGSEASCADVGPAVTVLTRRSGDIASAFNPPATTSQPDGIDVTSVVNKFQNKPGSPSKRAAQIQGNSADPNNDIDAIDCTSVVDAFRGLRFAYSGPCPCPSTVTCNATACTSAAQCPGGGCFKTCVGGVNAGLLCTTNTSCPGSTCGTGFCRDRCGRCTP